MSYALPKKNAAYTFYVSLVSQADTKLLKANPTLAAGDVKVSIDGGSFNNLATLPSASPASGAALVVALTAAEMNGDNIVVLFSDAAGAEWCDQMINIRPALDNFDGYFNAIPAAVWNALTSGLTTASSIGKLIVDNLNASITSRMATFTYTTPPTASDIATAVWGATTRTLSAATNLTTDIAAAVWGATTRTLSAATNLTADIASAVWGAVTRTLTSGGGGGGATAQEVWEYLTASITVSDTIGKLIVDNLNAAVSSRLATASYTSPPSAADIATTVVAALPASSTTTTTTSSSSSSDSGATITLKSGNTHYIDATMSPVVDITAASITFALFASRDADTAILTKTLASGISITSAEDGEFRVTILAADTSTLDPGLYWYECKITISSVTRTVFEGTLELQKARV